MVNNLRKNVSRRLICLYFTLALFTASSSVVAGPYISPGVQIGYTFGSSVFFSMQGTIGYIFADQDFSTGVTMGTKSYYKGIKTTYLDGQLFSIKTGFGVGAGRQREWVDHQPNKVSGLKVKLWSAYTGFPVINYEMYFRQQTTQHSIGGFFVLPIMGRDDYGKFININ